MERPSCKKCGTTFFKLVEDHTGFYTHCRCGTITLIHSKLEDTVSCSLDSLTDDEPTPVLRKGTRNENSVIYQLAVSFKEILGDKPCVSSSEVVEAFKAIPKFSDLSPNRITTNLAHLRIHNVIKAVEENRGKKGGSTWTISWGYDAYINSVENDNKDIIHSHIMELLVFKPLGTHDLRVEVGNRVETTISLREMYNDLMILSRRKYVRRCDSQSTKFNTVWTLGEDYKDFFVKHPSELSSKVLSDDFTFSFSKVEQGESVAYAHNFEQKSKGTMLSFVQQMYA